jgi:nicotinamide phosphoribosyltransferase
LQYPPNTSELVFYLESRGGRYPETLFFGLQYIMKEYLSKRVTMEDVEEAKTFIEAHGEPFNYEGWKYIVEHHDGKIPLEIRAVPEGAVIPTHNALMVVRTTDPKATFIGSWFETLLMRIWYPITVATQSFQIKKDILGFLERTSDAPMEEIPFKLHDFGSRGVSSRESAGIGGAAHLVSFMGSDTMEGIRVANNYYNHVMAGYSIPAAEHSTITAWGKAGEVDAYRNMLKQFAKPGSIVAVVSDSYDLDDAVINMWGKELKQEVLDSGATVVIRPDSGDPVSIVLETVTNLAKAFGTTTNTKGYEVLPGCIRVIQGDGINEQSIHDILTNLTNHGYSASNVTFGMGGALLQRVDRDTQKFAYKLSAIRFGNGNYKEVFKDPKTDPGKKSKGGRLDLVYEGGEYITKKLPNGFIDYYNRFSNSVMRTVFRDGEILIEEPLEKIRERANAHLEKE